MKISKVTDYAALKVEKFANLNDLSIRSFDCMVLRSFHTPSRYDFHSNVIRPSLFATEKEKISSRKRIFADLAIVCWG